MSLSNKKSPSRQARWHFLSLQIGTNRKSIWSNKKALSEIVAYVLLITISIALAILVYNWLRFYTNQGQDIQCPSDVSLMIVEYDYACNSNTLNITLRNKGLFTADGFVLRASDKQNSKIGIYNLNKTGSQIKTGNQENYLFPTSQDVDGKTISNSLTYIEIQPFIQENRKQVLCSKISSQTLNC